MYAIKDVSEMDMVFGCSAMELMPGYDEIPEEFKRGDTKWNKLVTEWFSYGLKKLKITPKDGVDKDKALRHLKTILGSREPKHEHKEAGAAFLMSEWFVDAEWEAREIGG